MQHLHRKIWKEIHKLFPIDFFYECVLNLSFKNINNQYISVGGKWVSSTYISTFFTSGFV